MALPRLTPVQTQQGLEKARDTRRKRARIRQQLKSGQLTLGEVLGRSHDEIIGRMRVSYLLQSLPKIGRVTAGKIMDEIGIHASRRIQGLGSRQIEALRKRLG